MKIDKKLFKSKTLMITGGTGSFGSSLLKKIIINDFKEIRIFSRDEKKQDDLRKKFPASNVKFYIGDVRDKDSIDEAIRGVDYIFHAAALKQVPSCEFHPLEAYKTNVLGTANVLSQAIKNRVRKVVCLSTDKAVYPINAMGISKAMMEKTMVAMSRNLEESETIICGTRYGNVMASRGSVIPLFIDQISNNLPLTVTNSDMTRFMMTLDDAIELVMFAFENGSNGDIFVQKSPAASISVLVEAICGLMGKKNYPIKNIGTRHGEKLFETLIGVEEMSFAEDMGDYYKIIPDSRNLNYENYIEKGSLNNSDLVNTSKDYNSDNTYQLNAREMKELLMKTELVCNLVKKFE